MKLYQIHFSPTGGTKKAAALLAAGWNCPQEEIPLLGPGRPEKGLSFTPEDICIIAVPSYGGRVPEPALKEIGRMQGNGAKAVLTVVYGNRAFDDTLLELQSAAEAAGFCPVAAVAAIAEHSIMRQYAAGRPNSKDAAQLAGFSREIQALLAQEPQNIQLKVPGNTPYREYHGVPMKPQVKKHRCTKCGACAALCPAGAISPAAPDSTDTQKCITCMGCVAACPNKARGLNKFMVFMGSRRLKKACCVPKENELFLPL